MKIIAVTGGIGSGKSTVCKVFSCFGVPVYDSDTVAKRLVRENKEIKAKIVLLLGEMAYTNGDYNTKYVASKVFEDKDLLLALNGIIHPFVNEDFENWKRNQTTSLIVKETALLFQTELWKAVDYSILVFASEELRIERVKQRDPRRSIEEIKGILDKQGNQNQYLAKADFVVYNNENQSVMYQVEGILKKIQS
jgi:dephospho-CoA kinase